jgi:hypothetical protein
MSRQSPTGFAFSMLVEIAAVVIIVSLLPRFDLRPAASAAAPEPVSVSTPPTLLAAFERPSPASPPSIAQKPLVAPPLFESPRVEPLPADRQFVEQRLDRASQQLVNSVGSAMSHVASDLAQGLQPAGQPVTPWSPPTQPERQVRLLPPLQSVAPTPAGSFPTQPRPWLRY